MKNSFCIFLFLLLANMTEAFSAENIQYCPNNIVCDKGNIQYCYPSGNKDKNWSGIKLVAWSKMKGVFSGNYKFTHTQALYHSRKVETPVTCYYTGDHSRYGTSTLALTYNTLANIEIYNASGSEWRISQDRGYCTTGNPKDCPLIESSTLIFTNKNVNSSVQIGRIKPVLANSSIKLIYEDALAACGTSPQCTLNITTKGNGIIGYVIFDLTNKLKVWKVTPFRPQEIEAAMIGDFNAVEVWYHN